MAATTTNWKNVNNWHWVEKNCMPWTIDYIKEKLGSLSAESEGTKVSVSEVVSVTGDADINQRKGKLITVYDIAINLKWKGENANGTTAEGKITVPEYMHDTDVDDMEVEVTAEKDDAERWEIKTVASKKLVPQLRAALANFSKDMISSRFTLCSQFVAVHGGTDNTRFTTGNAKDVHIAPEEMKGHPVTQAYKPKPVPSGTSETKQTSMSVIGGVTTLNMNVEFVCPVSDLYDTLLNPQRVQIWSRGAATIAPTVGAEIALFGGNVTGKVLELEKDKKIVMTWKLKSWPAGHFSKVTMTFETQRESVKLKVAQSDVPIGEVDTVRRNWENYYWNGIKAAFGEPQSIDYDDIGMNDVSQHARYRQAMNSRKAQPPQRPIQSYQHESIDFQHQRSIDDIDAILNGNMEDFEEFPRRYQPAHTETAQNGQYEFGHDDTGYYNFADEVPNVSKPSFNVNQPRGHDYKQMSQQQQEFKKEYKNEAFGSLDDDWEPPYQQRSENRKQDQQQPARSAQVSTNNASNASHETSAGQAVVKGVQLVSIKELPPTGSGKTVILELAIARILSKPGSDQAKIVYIAPIKVDEVHLLNEQKRGATLEVVISRMKTVEAELRMTRKSKDGSGMRFIAISATVPNIEDIATWLCDKDKKPAETKVFGEEFRPVKLDKVVLGFPSGKSENGETNSYQFEKSLDYKLLEVLRKFSHGKPSLFCSTRKSAMSAAELLCAESEKYGTNPFITSPNQRYKLQELAKKMTERKLGGSTSTLAVGVNLPAHLVVIKGTTQYVNGHYAPYSELDIMQMMGRAGRPQFDNSGMVVIMTVEEKQRYYENMVAGKEIVESNLHENLIEHLNAEIVLGTISNIELSIEWLKSSFLYVRIKKNPTRYKISVNDKTVSPEKRLMTICMKDLELLANAKMVDQADDGMTLSPTEFGRIMAKYYIRFETARSIVELKPSPSLKAVLECLCAGKELQEVRFRMDKAHLNALNKAVMMPIKGKVKTPADKVNILLQVCLGAIPFTEQKTAAQLSQETNLILPHAARIARCMIDMLVAKKDFTGIQSSIELSNSLHAKTWRQCQPLKQLENIGPAMAKSLEESGIRTFEDLRQSPPDRIEMILGRNPPFGTKILAAADTLPQLNLILAEFKEYNSKSSEVELIVTLGLHNADKVKTSFKKGGYQTAFIAGTSDNQVVDFRRVSISKLKDNQSFRLKIPRKSYSVILTCSLIAEDFVGISVTKTMSLDGDPRAAKKAFAESTKVKPFKVPAATELQMPNSSETSGAKSNKENEFNDDDDLYVGDITWEEAVALEEATKASLQSRINKSEPRKETKPLQESKSKHTNLTQSQSNVSQSISNKINKSSKSSDLKGLGDIYKVALEEGRVPCAHHCRHKATCEHLCCKKGVPMKTAKKRKHGLSNATNMDSSNRTLTDYNYSTTKSSQNSDAEVGSPRFKSSMTEEEILLKENGILLYDFGSDMELSPDPEPAVSKKSKELSKKPKPKESSSTFNWNEDDDDEDEIPLKVNKKRRKIVGLDDDDDDFETSLFKDDFPSFMEITQRSKKKSTSLQDPKLQNKTSDNIHGITTPPSPLFSSDEDTGLRANPTPKTSLNDFERTLSQPKSFNQISNTVSQLSQSKEHSWQPAGYDTAVSSQSQSRLTNNLDGYDKHNPHIRESYYPPITSNTKPLYQSRLALNEERILAHGDISTLPTRNKKETELDRLNKLHHSTGSSINKPWLKNPSNLPSAPPSYLSARALSTMSQSQQQSLDATHTKPVGEKPWLTGRTLPSSSQPIPQARIDPYEFPYSQPERESNSNLSQEITLRRANRASSYPTPSRSQPHTKKTNDFRPVISAPPKKILKFDLGEATDLVDEGPPQEDQVGSHHAGGLQSVSRSSSPDLWKAADLKSPNDPSKKPSSTSTTALPASVIVPETKIVEKKVPQIVEKAAPKQMTGLMQSLGKWVASLEMNAVDDELPPPAKKPESVVLGTEMNQASVVQAAPNKALTAVSEEDANASFMQAFKSMFS
ncbi:Sec63 [Chytridiales sp. JEL 0842]|nr:Sec63 [Chytridiales sp. JEL 0842]